MNLLVDIYLEFLMRKSHFGVAFGPNQLWSIQYSELSI